MNEAFRTSCPSPSESLRGPMLVDRKIRAEECAKDRSGRALFPGNVLFKLHDTHGLNVADASMWLIKHGWSPNLYEFGIEAAKNGWSNQHIDACIAEAIHTMRDTCAMSA